MANFINKYLSQSVYDADSTKQYPNTSLVGNDIVFQMTEPTPPAFGGLTVKYNIEDPTQEVTLFNGGGASSSSSSSSSSESGGGGALPTTMIVDGNPETPINTWRFETAGEHIVQYEFADNIVPAGFMADGGIPATEAIIGDDITEITGSSANVYGAFQYSNITTITIGTGITTIGDSAFGASYLETLTINANTPPTLGSSVFADSSITAIYVPSSVVDAYKNSTSTGWSEYASIIQAIQ